VKPKRSLIGHEAGAEDRVGQPEAQGRDEGPTQCRQREGHRRSALAAANAAPLAAAEAIAAGPEDGDEDEKDDDQGLHHLDRSGARREGSADAVHREFADEDEGEEDHDGNEESEEQLEAAAGIFQTLAAEDRIAPEVAPQTGLGPEAVDAQRDQTEQRVLQGDPGDRPGSAQVVYAFDRPGSHRPIEAVSCVIRTRHGSTQSS
jgi:hypothetical protein